MNHSDMHHEPKSLKRPIQKSYKNGQSASLIYGTKINKTSFNPVKYFGVESGNLQEVKERRNKLRSEKERNVGLEGPKFKLNSVRALFCVRRNAFRQLDRSRNEMLLCTILPEKAEARKCEFFCLNYNEAHSLTHSCPQD